MGVLFTETVNTGEGADLGGRHQDFRFGHIKFEISISYASGDVKWTVRNSIWSLGEKAKWEIQIYV